MEYVVVGLVALVAAGLTFFSGFGLGTLLLPAFALFVPAEIAVGATAVVHLANTLFKLGLVGRHADRRVAVRFGMPAVVAACVGAGVLGLLSRVNEPVASYAIAGRACEVTPMGLVVGAMIVAFAGVEALPQGRKITFGVRWLTLGGVLSGFFGGLSGHQGALRSAFLLRAGLTRDGLVGTGAVCSAMVDITRLSVYGATAAVAGRSGAMEGAWPETGWAIGVGCACALAGSVAGARLVKNVTVGWLRGFVAVSLGVFGAAMAGGVV